MAKKATEETNEETVETVVVTALVQLCEGGETYIAGETFETTPARAAALGENVEVIG